MEDDSNYDNIKSGGYGNSEGGNNDILSGSGMMDNLSTNILLPKIAFYVYLVMTILAIVAILAASSLALSNKSFGAGITGMIFGIISIAPLLFITFVLYNCKEGRYQN